MTTLTAWPDSDDQHKYPTLAWVRAHQRIGGIGKGHQEGCDLDEDYIAYERARAEAAIQRLRLLKDACEDEGHEHGRVKNGFCSCFICKALQAIGEIPE